MEREASRSEALLLLLATGWTEMMAVLEAEGEKGLLIPARSTSREVRVVGWR